MRIRAVPMAALLGLSSMLALAEDARPKVMILGTFHFEGSTEDAISVAMGDLTTPATRSTSPTGRANAHSPPTNASRSRCVWPRSSGTTGCTPWTTSKTWISVA